MDMPNKRLRLARERAGYETAAQAARAFGWSVPGYSHHENGTRGMSPEVASRYARAFRASPSWLLLGSGEEPITSGAPQEVPSNDTIRAVPIVGRTESGSFSETPISNSFKEYMPVALAGFEHASLFAVRAADDSAGAAYPQGAYAAVCPTPEIGVREGDHVVVARWRGDLAELTIRYVIVRRDVIMLWRLSGDDDIEEALTVGDNPNGHRVEILGVVVATYVVRPIQTRPLLFQLGSGPE